MSARTIAAAVSASLLVGCSHPLVQGLGNLGGHVRGNMLLARIERAPLEFVLSMEESAVAWDRAKEFVVKYGSGVNGSSGEVYVTGESIHSYARLGREFGYSITRREETGSYRFEVECETFYSCSGVYLDLRGNPIVYDSEGGPYAPGENLNTHILAHYIRTGGLAPDYNIAVACARQ